MRDERNDRRRPSNGSTLVAVGADAILEQRLAICSHAEAIDCIKRLCGSTSVLTDRPPSNRTTRTTVIAASAPHPQRAEQPPKALVVADQVHHRFTSHKVAAETILASFDGLSITFLPLGSLDFQHCLLTWVCAL